MILEWREYLSTGVEQVDNQHKEIFKRLKNLFEACCEEKGNEEVLNLINFLENYVIEHFRDEEALQENCSYKNIERPPKSRNIVEPPPIGMPSVAEPFMATYSFRKYLTPPPTDRNEKSVKLLPSGTSNVY